MSARPSGRRAVVRASLEDAGGDRCVDILEADDGFAWVECRRDPEDPHGWRRLHPPVRGYVSATEARAAAVAATWLSA